MTWLLGALTARLRRWLAGLTVVVALIALAWSRGRRSARQAERLRQQRKRADDMERIADDMAESSGARPDAAREWLRRFGARR